MAAALRLGTRDARLLLSAMVLGSAVTFVNASVINIALPAVAEDFDTDLSGVQLVANGYLFTLAALILLGGSIGDLFGRRRAFLIGCATLAAGSAMCAVAPTLGALVGGRLVQGCGAALVTPASLAIVDVSFHPDDQSRAIGAWAAGSSFATTGAPFVGGWLVDEASWRWVFVISLPLLAFTAWLTVRAVPETRDLSGRRALDVPGAAAAVLAVGGIVYALVEGPTAGWDDSVVVAAGVVGLLAAAAFVPVERRRLRPMVPFGLFASRQFSGTNAVTLVMYFALSGAFFFLAIQLQTVLGYSALAAGAATVPINVLLVVGSPAAGRLAATHGPQLPLVVGPLVAGAGILWLAAVGEGDGYVVDVLPGMVVFGAGLATMVAPLTAAVMASAPEPDVGVASAVNNAVARFAGLLATALLPAVAGISGEISGEAFSAGYTKALVICAVLCALAAVVSWRSIERCVETHTDLPVTPVAGCMQRSLPAAAGDAAQPR